SSSTRSLAPRRRSGGITGRGAGGAPARAAQIQRGRAGYPGVPAASVTPAEGRIYLDHAATTPVDPLVMEAMLPYLCGPLSSGNPSSVHSFGRDARTAIDQARDLVAQLIGADYSEITFTGSGTEADNLALTGTMFAAP